MSVRKTIFLLLLALPVSVFTQGWKNPMVLENEWPNYGIGDPYVLKHNGRFYLYCSTKDWSTGVKTWSSKDLATWTYEGLCSEDPITKSAFAPEVFYWNGVYYMYTSPAGNGHYVLTSDSPTGPFTVATSNLGRWIDGSTFTDDDGSRYFYHASPWGIQGCPMPTPTSFGTSVSLNAQMGNAWTEGSCLFKRNGIYYMIYTGNHLRTAGYRIDYGTNTSGPLEEFTPAVLQNPILLNTLGDHIGLGHGSIFIGPDLDSYYITYHSRVTRDPRLLNFDRIAWNGEKMILLGSTNFEQQGAALPDAYDYFERDTIGSGWTFPNDGNWSIEENCCLIQDAPFEGVEIWYKALLDSVTHDNFTAEFNLKELVRESDDARSGAVFSYEDEGTFGIALIHGATKKLEVNFLNEHSWDTPQYFDLPADFDYAAWHTIRIEKFNGQLRFFVDGSLIATILHDPGPGQIGYLTSRNHMACGFIGFSNFANGSGVFDVYKPLPGTIDAVLYNSGGEGFGFHEETQGTPGEFLRIDQADMVKCARGGYALHEVETGNWYTYNVNVESEGLYNCELVYSAAASTGKIRILSNGTDVSGTIDLPSTEGNNNYRSLVIKDIQLPGGYQTLKLEVVSGSYNLYSVRFVHASNGDFDKKDEFVNSRFGFSWAFYDGYWLFTNGMAEVDGYGKSTIGNTFWADYTVEADLRFSYRMDAGLLFRVNNPARGGAANDPGNDPVLGRNFFQGYSVRFSLNNVILYKHNYDKKLLTTGPGSFQMDTWYHLRIEVVADSIKVYVDDMEQELIAYRDTIPFINGMAGLHSYNTNTSFDNFRVTSDLDLGPYVISDVMEEKDNQIRIYPNPASGTAMIDLGYNRDSRIRIIDPRGGTLLTFRTSQDQFMLPANTLPPGMYLVMVEDNHGIHTRKLILK